MASLYFVIAAIVFVIAFTCFMIFLKVIDQEACDAQEWIFLTFVALMYSISWVFTVPITLLCIVCWIVKKLFVNKVADFIVKKIEEK